MGSWVGALWVGACRIQQCGPSAPVSTTAVCLQNTTDYLLYAINPGSPAVPAGHERSGRRDEGKAGCDKPSHYDAKTYTIDGS